MNRKTIMIAVLSVALLAAGTGLVQAHGRNWDDGGRGGYGMMGQRGGFGGGYGCDGPRYNDCEPGYGRGYRGEGRRDLSANITQDEAKELVERRVSRNPYLKVGKITENEGGFEIQIVTKKGGELVNRLQLDKDTGRMYRVFEE